MEGKKISFAFMKTKKVEKLPVQEKKDFIECVEEKSIKVVGGDEVKEIAPLVIPMKPNTLITAERLKEIAEKVESVLEEPEIKEEPMAQETVPENETLEEMAVRELMEDSKKAVKVNAPQLNLVLPMKSVTSGEKESTLDDYESVPVQDFGLAMLRGMGWTKNTEKSTFKPPQLRPKGLGLGADKVIKENNKQKAAKNSKDEELTIVKNAFVKITSGKYSGYYGKVVSLDEDNGRVMVDITVKKETVSLSEFMMHPVPKSEFDKESNVINANSFEQYKKNEGQRPLKNEKESSKDRNNRDEKQKHGREGNTGNDNNNYSRSDNEKLSVNKERNRDRLNRDKHRQDSEDKYSKKRRDSSCDSLSESDSEKNKKALKNKKRYSSMESLESDTERDKKRHHRKSKKSEKERRRHDSDSESEYRSKKNKERKRHESDSEMDSRKSKTSEKERYRYDSESDHRIRKKSNKEHRRQDSDSESERIRKKDKESRHESDSESDNRKSKRSVTPEGKRDIDKKRKGKKKKRDRDRSPNYRKHRK